MKPELPLEAQSLWETLNLIEGAVDSMTRANIAKTLSLSRTTASNLVSQLMDLQLVEEMESTAKGRGRPAIPLRLSPAVWSALGASFHGNHWSFMVVNLLGNTLYEEREHVEPVSEQSFLESLVVGLRKAISQAPGKLLPLIGIGSPGLVNSDTGIIIRADDLGWKEIDLGGKVQADTGYQCYSINRHRASGLAEVRFGSGQSIKNLVYIGIGTGISAAFINNGILLEGTDFSAGEIGHMLIDPAGPLCGCGRYGCLQAFSSSSALVRLLSERFRSAQALGEVIGPNTLWDALERGDLSGTQIANEANLGNPIAIECMQKISVQLGIAVSNIINMVNPQKIIIGGALGNSGPLLADLIRQEAASRAMSSPFSTVQIEMSRLGNRAGPLGAACIPLKYKLELVLGGLH